MKEKMMRLTGLGENECEAAVAAGLGALVLLDAWVLMVLAQALG